jgi:uridylate kinase
VTPLAAAARNGVRALPFAPGFAGAGLEPPLRRGVAQRGRVCRGSVGNFPDISAIDAAFPRRFHAHCMCAKSATTVKYKRVILKLSGEVLRGKGTEPIDAATLERMCEQVKEIHDLGVQVCVVIGGGNIFRGLQGAKRGVDRTTGDYMGMLATVINGLAIMDCLEKMGVKTRVQSAIPMNQIAEPFIMRRAMRHLEKGRVVIFVAGTGNPYFSTDTTAALRASELHADIIMKATKVDGIYDKDPKKFPDAVKYEELTFIEALKERLNVMDSTAFSLCLDNNVPILVFNLDEDHAIRKAVSGAKIGTLVHG